MKLFWLLPLTPRDFLRAGIASLALSFGFCILLHRYWTYFHLDTAGNWFTLAFLLLPLSTLGGTILCLAANVHLRARFVPKAVASWTGVLVLACLLAFAFGAELARTRIDRHGEGPGAGALAPFFLSLVPGR